MSIFLFFILIIICFYFLNKRPAIVLTYILFFQNLNNMIFSDIGFPELKYLTTFLFLSIIFLNHFNFNQIVVNFLRFKQIPFFRSYFFLIIYILIYGFYLGTSYELEYIRKFLFPGLFLCLIPLFTFQKLSFYEDLLYGFVIFISFLGIYMILTKGFLSLSDRVFDSEGISAITQGRLAGLLTIFSSYLFFYSKKNSIYIKAILAFTAVSSLIWLSFTGTRGAFVCLILTLIIYFILSEQKISSNIYIVLTFFIFFQILLYFDFFDLLVFERFSNETSIENSTRALRYKIFFNELPKYFVFGAGPGGWSKQIWGGEFRYPHNIIMEFIIEYGFLGLLVFLSIYFSLYKIIIKIIKNTIDFKYLTPIVLGWSFVSIHVMFSGGFLQGNDIFFTYSALISIIGLLLKKNNLNKI